MVPSSRLPADDRRGIIKVSRVRDAGNGMTELSTTNDNELSDILDRVKTWTPALRMDLARRVLETLEPPGISIPPRQMSLEEVVGLIKTDQPAPSDAECEKIIGEERLRKYG